MKKIILIWSIFLLLPLVNAADCTHPDIFADVNTELFHVNGQLKLTLTVSQDPPPSLSCGCLDTVNQCRLRALQNVGGVGFANINPTTSFDLNCSGANCFFNHPYGEDVPHDFNITCANQRTFFLLGRIATYAPIISNIVKVECYPAGQPGYAISACTPPINGNFDLNSFCKYIDVNVLIDQNYYIYDNGHAIHNNADVNFTNGIEIHRVRVSDGGQFDRNNTNVFIGLNEKMNENLPLGILLVILFITIGYPVWILNKKINNQKIMVAYPSNEEKT